MIKPVLLVLISFPRHVSLDVSNSFFLLHVLLGRDITEQVIGSATTQNPPNKCILSQGGVEFEYSKNYTDTVGLPFYFSTFYVRFMTCVCIGHPSLINRMWTKQLFLYNR